MKYLIIVFFCFVVHIVNGQKSIFYVGSTNNNASNSIAICELDESKAEIAVITKSNGGIAPSYLTVSNDKKFLYAVSAEKFDTKNPYHQITAFSVLKNGKDIAFLNKQSSLGDNPCHISNTNKGDFVFVANYSSGNITAFPVSKDGKLMEASSTQQHKGIGPNTSRQEGPHAHYIHPSNDDKYIFSADLGIDKVMNYKLTKDGKLEPNKNQEFLKLSPGAGPRHIAFHKNNKQIFILNELNSTTTSCGYNSENGKLTIVDTQSTLPKDYSGTTKAAAIRIHPNGKYLYCSNRGYNSIAVFEIKKSGKLKQLQVFTDKLGWVRDFNISASGKYLIAGNAQTNEIVLLKIDAAGKLSSTNQKLEFPKPSCIVFY